jgi:acetylornithine/N-succinyldiaminopimelate aminotransferase
MAERTLLLSDALMPTYARADLAFERGEGVYLFTPEGRRYLDFASGIAVTALGHSHPHLVAAITEQAGKLWHCSNLYQIPEGARLAERLVASSFADRVFFCNSGAEAVEGAMKIARKNQQANGHPERTRIITCSSAFHGRTMTTLSAAGNPKYLDGFGPASPGFDHVAFGNLNEVRMAVGPETAAILIEPIQGEGGIRPADAQFLAGLRAACDEFGLLLIYDEVQCGMGRTGKLFAYELSGVAPDIMALAKGLGGGFPLGAILASKDAAVGMAAGSHGSTFGGNPLAMAVGNAVLDVMLEEGFLEQVRRNGQELHKRLEAQVEKHPLILEELRGSGMMLGLKCAVPCGDLVAALRDGGLLTLAAAENVVRILPPLILGLEGIEEAEGIIDQACRHLEKAEAISKGVESG